MKCFVIPVIVGATGNITKRLKYLETIQGKHSTDYSQKSGVPGAAIVVRCTMVQEERYQGKRNL
jgi:hypothetical protein